jgi:hypothetical protein
MPTWWLWAPLVVVGFRLVAFLATLVGWWLGEDALADEIATLGPPSNQPVPRSRWPTLALPAVFVVAGYVLVLPGYLAAALCVRWWARHSELCSVNRSGGETQ